MSQTVQRVLLVEDNEDDYVIVRDLLTDIIDGPVSLEWVTTRAAASAALMQGNYDVCLLDYHLGAYTGLELLQELPATSPVPVILLTGSEDYRIDVAAAQAGASDYLVKDHINAPLLERSIRYAIQRKASETALLQAQRFAQATVDALKKNIAVLNGQGIIIAVNAAWRAFAEANGFMGAGAGVGANYLQVCDTSGILEGHAAAMGIRAVMSGEQELFSLEYPCHSPHEERWFEMRVTRFTGDGPLHVVVAHENITERKQAEAALRESNEKFLQLANNIGDVFWMRSPDMRELQYLSPAFERIWGRSIESLYANAEQWHEFIVPEDREHVLGIFSMLQRDAPSISCEYRIVRPDGGIRWVYTRGFQVRNDAGELIRLTGVSSDITERKQAELELQRERDFSTAVIDTVGNLVVVLDRKSHIVRFNYACEQLSGYKFAEVQGKDFMNLLVLPQERESVRAAFKELCAGHFPNHYENYWVDRQGHCHLITWSNTALLDANGQVEYVIGTGLDITERKRAEMMLREREEFQRALLENFPNGSVNVFDRDLRYVLAAGGGLEQSGLAQERLLGKTLEEAFSPEEAALAKPYYQRVLAGEPVGFELFYNGRFYNINATPLRDQENTICNVLAVAQDITGRKQAEAQRDRFFTLSLEMLSIAGLDGYFKRINPAFLETLGYTEAELLAQPFLELVHPDDWSATQAIIEQLWQGQPVVGFENRYRTKNGAWRWLEWKSASAPEEGLIYAAARDVTQRKESEAALRRMRDELEIRVEERTLELTKANAETRTRARQQEAVAELGRRALTDIDMDTLLAGATALVTATLDVELSGVLELLPNGDTLRIRAGTGWGKEMLNQLVPGQKGSQAGYALLSGAPLVVADLRTDPRFTPPPFMLERGIISGMTVVVPGYERPFGTLGAHTVQQRHFTQDDVNFLLAMANVLAAAIERHRIETEIRQLNTQLQEANQQLNAEKQEAEQARENAEIANRAKSEFLSRMSHELRTPLNAIIGFGQVMAMRSHDVDPQQQDNIQQILKAGRHLLDLINEVLDIARIEAGRLALSPEPVAVGQMVREVLDLVRPLAAARQIELVNEVPQERGELQVLADPQRLKQVLLNFLSNAVKYNHDRGRVMMSCAEVGDESINYENISCQGRLRLRVQDTGPGLTPGDMERLFVPFERLGAAHTKIEGSGIGLSLCKQLVEAMNGQVGVESEVGQGSAFWLELPLVQDVKPKDAPMQSNPTSVALGQNGQVSSGSVDSSSPRGWRPPHGSPPISTAASFNSSAAETRYTILYIEDNPSNIRLMERLLANLGSPLGAQLQLLTAMQGSLGLDLAAEHQPHLILLDVNLPDIMGDVVLSRLKANPVTECIPVVVLSADATPGQIEQLLNKGANYYLTKPLDVEQFKGMLEATLAG